MSDFSESQEWQPRDERHTLWLEMQAAYQSYKTASNALENRSDDGSYGMAENSAPFEDYQRAAFERYVDARMAFLECSLDCGGNMRADGPASTMPQSPKRGDKSRFGTLVLTQLAVALLCVTGFFGIRQRREVRDLQASYAKLEVMLDQHRDRLDVIGRKLDAPRATDTGAPGLNQKVTHTAIAPSRPAISTPTKGRSVRAARRNIVSKPVLTRVMQPKVIRKVQSNGPSAVIGTQKDYKFTLVTSRRFTRVGPIAISLKAVDPNRSHVTLSIASDSGKMEFQYVKLNQPLWITVRDRGEPLQLLVNWIGFDAIAGRLIEPPYRKQG